MKQWESQWLSLLESSGYSEIEIIKDINDKERIIKGNKKWLKILFIKQPLTKAMAQCSDGNTVCDDIRNKLISGVLESNDAEKIIDSLIKEKFY